MKVCIFASLLVKKVGRSLNHSVRGALRLGNFNNGVNAGSCMLNGNNAPSNANANRGAVHSNPYKVKEGEPFLTEEHIERWRRVS